MNRRKPTLTIPITLSTRATISSGRCRLNSETATVHSPSFTLDNQYQAGKLTLHHFDFYRLFEPGVMRDELAEILEEPGAVVVVEWGRIVQDVLPPERLVIRIRATGEHKREITFSAPPKLKYLLPANT